MNDDFVFKRILLTAFLWLMLSISAGAQQLEYYLADTVGPGARPAVIVCPGGSYSWLDLTSEGHMVAERLQAKGMHAVVLHYRVQGVTAFWSHYRYLARGHQYPDALEDVKQALHILRSHSEDWHIDTTRVGVMGFSAGGHLAVQSAELLDAGPDFVAAIYPVVTFVEQPYVHKRSRRALLGEWGKHNATLCDSLSLERHVRADMAPVFLLNCLDDPIVHYHNSELLDSALTAEGVSHRYVQYQTGGHGFGANPDKGSAESRNWLDQFWEWFSEEF